MSPSSQKLPLWRLISGILVLGSLLAVSLAIAPVYVADYRFNRYVRELAASREAAKAPDAQLKSNLVNEAGRLHLPVQISDVTIQRNGDRVQLQIARIKAQVWHADLHFSAVTTK